MKQSRWRMKRLGVGKPVSPGRSGGFSDRFHEQYVMVWVDSEGIVQGGDALQQSGKSPVLLGSAW